MKKSLCIILFLITVFSYSQDSANFSDSGSISINDGKCLFIIVLVNDLNGTIAVWDIPGKVPSIKTTKKTEINGEIAPFIVFGAEEDRNVFFTYDCKLKKPDGTFSVNEVNDLVIAQRDIKAKILFRSRASHAVIFDETDSPGTYQFHITIKDHGEPIHDIILEFELAEQTENRLNE